MDYVQTLFFFFLVCHLLWKDITITSITQYPVDLRIIDVGNCSCLYYLGWNQRAETSGRWFTVHWALTSLAVWESCAKLVSVLCCAKLVSVLWCWLVIWFQSVIVKSIEDNVLNMYEARRLLLKLEKEAMPGTGNSLSHHLSPSMQGMGSILSGSCLQNKQIHRCNRLLQFSFLNIKYGCGYYWLTDSQWMATDLRRPFRLCALS